MAGHREEAMRAFITTTPGYLSMAQEAGRRLMEYGRVDGVDYVQCSDKDACHKGKLEVWLDYNAPVWSCDADWWMLQPCSLPEPKGNLALAAPCEGMEERYIGTGVPWKSAFCSCLVGLDMGSKEIRGCVQEAIKLQGRDYRSDEKFLNIALLTKPWIVFGRLKNSWNWCSTPDKNTIGLHAAERSDKLEWLRSNTSLANT